MSSYRCSQNPSPRSSAGSRPIPRGQDRREGFRCPFTVAHLNERPDDRTDHMFQKTICVRVNRHHVSVSLERQLAQVADRVFIVGEGAFERRKVM